MSIETKQDNMSRKIHLGISPLRQEAQSYSNLSTRQGTRNIIDTRVNTDGNYKDTDTHVAGAYSMGVNNVDGSTEVISSSPSPADSKDKKVDDALNQLNNKPYKDGAFENDGRSRDKFNSRIAKATDEGRYGKAKRLKNRKANYMANQVEKSGFDPNSVEGKAISAKAQEAKQESLDVGGGTGFGKFLRKTF